jgi:pyruvate/2-oxoglutarate dehydrogenase complex dihydrolipoamide acyltransferase (E2) component
MRKPKHQIVRFPASRIGTIDLGRIGLSKHHVAGLLEVDVTAAREQLRRQRREGKSVSFFAWAVKSIATVLAENRYAHALRGGDRRLVLFEDVDLSVMVERTVQGSRVPLAMVIRKANEKTAEVIDGEIHQAQTREIHDEGDYVLSERSPSRLAMRLFYALPQGLRVLLMKRLLASPFRSKDMMGTAIVTSVGAGGRLAGWVIPRAMHNLCFALGSVVRKPWVVGGEVAVRDILHLTVLFDHDAVDGAPAMRFVSRLVDRLQKAT